MAGPDLFLRLCHAAHHYAFGGEGLSKELMAEDLVRATGAPSMDVLVDLAARVSHGMVRGLQELKGVEFTEEELHHQVASLSSAWILGAAAGCDATTGRLVRS